MGHRERPLGQVCGTGHRERPLERLGSVGVWDGSRLRAPRQSPPPSPRRCPAALRGGRSRAAPPRRHRPSRRRCRPRGPCEGTLGGERGRRPPRTSLCGAGGDCRGRGALPALASLPPAAERLPARLSGGCGHCGPRTSAGLFSSRLPCGPPRLRLEHPPPPPPPLSPSPPPPPAPPAPPRS